MKTSKKIIIPFFSTIVGLSLAAGIGGALAWYQYNSQASVSFIGSSVADTGVLQIGYLYDHDNNDQTPDIMHWGRDFYSADVNSKLVPVTFGQLETENEGQANEKTLVLPDTAYAYPDASKVNGSGYQNWEVARKGKDYAQFELYFRALQPDPDSQGDPTIDLPAGYKLVERNVFLSNYVLDNVEQNKVANEAVRIHIDVENGKNRLLSKNAYTAQEPLNLYGPLDLDMSGDDDTYHQSAFRDIPTGHTEGETIQYGVENDVQVTEAIESVKQVRDGNDLMPVSGTANFEKRILRTASDGNVKVTITVWLEGWEYLKVGTENEQDVKDQIWNAKYSAGTDVKVGLEFDTGKFRQNDLAQ